MNALPKLHEKKQPKPHVNWQTSSNQHKPLIEVTHLSKEFELGRGQTVKAVNDLSFHIYPGETLGLVGESGSGKSTTGRTILQLHQPTYGEVLYQGIPITRLTKKQLKAMRRHMQIIFQDPYSSLNPRKKSLILLGRH